MVARFRRGAASGHFQDTRVSPLWHPQIPQSVPPLLVTLRANGGFRPSPRRSQLNGLQNHAEGHDAERITLGHHPPIDRREHGRVGNQRAHRLRQIEGASRPVSGPDSAITPRSHPAVRRRQNRNDRLSKNDGTKDLLRNGSSYKSSLEPKRRTRWTVLAFRTWEAKRSAVRNVITSVARKHFIRARPQSGSVSRAVDRVREDGARADFDGQWA
jgi:hypothetical protein